MEYASSRTNTTTFLIAVTCVLLWLIVSACDSGISGTVFENQPPETSLSVRDTSLVDNLSESERLASTVLLSWSGDDPDGFVQNYELRYYERSTPPSSDAGWSSTARTDTLILLPITRGERTADVAFEVRAIDNEGARDPTPARSVFPIENGPPSIRFSPYELPPDTTFSVVSLAWVADDPEGFENLLSIDVSFNDSTSFVSIPPEFDFATFVGQYDIQDTSTDVVEARAYLGRGFSSSDIRVPGLRLDADNTFYIRAVDATDTTSVVERVTWHVKRRTSEILYVDDYRKSSSPTVGAFHLDLLHEFVGASTPIDTWTITTPYVTGSTGNTPRSNLLPPTADPTLRRMLAEFRFIYWVSTNTTNQITGNNLPFAANVMDLFFENGGKMMVHTPISLPTNPDDNLGNAAILLLPISEMVTIPDSLRPSLRMLSDAQVSPVASLPAVTTPLPELSPRFILLNTLPYVVEGGNYISLYEADYVAYTRQGSVQQPWSGATTVASISIDQRVGLFALPLVNDISGEQLFIGTDGDTDAPRRAVKLILESLGFPKQ